MNIKQSWKEIPLGLKIIFILSLVWIVWSCFAMPIKFEQGLPFFGTTLYGYSASMIILFLDFLGPIVFLYALWYKKSWWPKVAYLYISVFVLNSIAATLTHGQQLGIINILIPAIVYVIFWIVIYWNRKFFLKS